MSTVVLEKSDITAYPQECFDPDEAYPEYPFGKEAVQSGTNAPYRLIRAALRDLELDTEHYGTPAWNPLGSLVKPGQTIVVKPNLVMDRNENAEAGPLAMDCLITHPSCLRAIVDYAVIALHGQGRIIIADAPMQGCQFQDLIQKMHLDTLLDFYRQHDIRVDLVDMRQFEAKFNANKVIIAKKMNPVHGVTVHLGGASMHCQAPGNEEYQVSDYEKRETIAHHHGHVHDYEVAETVLQADLLINFSKPKTHRLAGITAALKNMVGATYNKATLPHRKAGSVQEGGDAYLHKSWLKRMSDAALTAKIRAEAQHRYGLATLLRYAYGAFLVSGMMFSGDKYYIGSWYGNDTIWRTVVDLNYIVRYANREGELHPEPQRQILYLADMIVAGEGNGPVSPSPKPLGVILGSLDGAAIDRTVCHIMGFDESRIPMMRGLNSGTTFLNKEDPTIKSNLSDCQGPLSKVKLPSAWHFKPHKAWRKELTEWTTKS